MKFPDKIIMQQKDKKKCISLIPKLDLSKVQEKYNIENMKKINIPQLKIIKNIVKKENNVNDIEGKKKNYEKLKKKLEKYQKGYMELKEKYIKLKEYAKLSNNKIELLEVQIKKITNGQSTEDVTNNRCDVIGNTSLVKNFLFFRFLFKFLFLNKK